jgi:hypothetical protein
MPEQVEIIEPGEFNAELERLLAIHQRRENWKSAVELQLEKRLKQLYENLYCQNLENQQHILAMDKTHTWDGEEGEEVNTPAKTS